MLEASNLKTMESWYQNLSPYVNDKEFPLRGGKKDLPPVLIGLRFPTSTVPCSKTRHLPPLKKQVLLKVGST